MNRKIKQYAASIIEVDRNQLVMELRFLSYAINTLKPMGLSDTNLTALHYATDGIHFYYDEKKLVKDFMKKSINTSRIYLHSVLHCLYLHPYFAGQYKLQDLWDLACDFFVFDIICHVYPSEDDPRKDVLDSIKQTTGIISAQNLYRLLENMLVCGTMTENEIKHMAKAFYVDDHILWYMPRDEHQDGAYGNSDSEKVLREWQKAADYTQVELESALANGGLQKGDHAGALIELLNGIRNEGVSYSDFLRSFSALEERMHIDPDAFDYNYYMYGLQLYHDMPLVEPLEYKEMHTIREFVIAIDTSASCETELVRKFLTKTYSILKDNIFTDEGLDVHIIQCDADIQDDATIHNQKELEKYIDKLYIYGRGGTDFRPVFKRISEHQANGQLKNLRGLLYFTDGYGDYPTQPTKYKTAFIFSEDYPGEDVPDWIIKYHLRKDFANS